MGSGYKNFTAASVLTAADLNNYCQSQSVMYFPTIAGAGGRDTVITAPVDGMVAYIGSNDADEGLYTYNGTSWRKGPGWNAPWGLVARSQTNGSGTATSGTTETAIFTSASFTAVSNRYYRINISTTVNATAGDTYSMRIRQDSTSGTVWWNGNIIFGTGVTTVPVHSMGSNTLTAGSHTFLLTMARASGSGTASIGTLVLCNMTVEDMGPSGAPV